MFNIDHSPRRFLTTGRQTRKTDSLLAKTGDYTQNPANECNGDVTSSERLFPARGRTHLLKARQVLWSSPIKLAVSRVEKVNGDVFHIGHVLAVLLHHVSGFYVAPLNGWFWRGSQTSNRFSPGKVGLAKISFDFRHGHGQFQLRIFVQ